MDEDGIRAAIEAGLEMADANKRTIDWCEDEKGKFEIPIAFLGKNMRTEVLTEVMSLIASRKPGPHRRQGMASFSELASFIEHVNRFKVGQTVVFANMRSLYFESIYDYHAADQPGWLEHRARYSCPLSREWQTWTSMDGKTMTQQQFADFIEEHYEDLTSPNENDDGANPVDVMEMARNLAVYTKGRFERKINPTTGESAMVCKEEHGESSTRIPRCFYLALPVFENGIHYRIEARVRFRMVEGRPTFSFRLYRSQAIIEDAFGAVRDEVAKKTKLPVWAGVPE